MRVPLPLWLRSGSDAISPTAHYTGHVWVRNDLSHPELATLEGRLLFEAIAPAMRASRLLGGPTLEGLLLARHRIIDHLLTRAIDDGRITQVIEVACGMSPRGWRFVERHGDGLVYIEADLPEMAERKRRALEKMGTLGENHRVVELDALRDEGPESLSGVASGLDRGRGLAIVTEGLLTYFDEDDVLGMWRRFARELRRFSAGLYLADVRLRDYGRPVVDHAFQAILSTFVQRRLHTHCGSEEDAVKALLEAGFSEATVHRADRHRAAGTARSNPAAERIHIIEATTPHRV